MADISTSQSDSSRFIAWSNGVWASGQAASAESEYGGCRREHPQTNEVWQDWKTRRVIAGQRIRMRASALRRKSKGTGRNGCSGARRWKSWGIDGILTGRSTSRWQRFRNTSMRLLCSSWHALTYERVRANLDPSLSWCWPSTGAEPGKLKHGGRKLLLCPEAWKESPSSQSKCPNVLPKVQVPSLMEIFISFYCRCVIYTIASRQSELFSSIQGLKRSDYLRWGRQKVWFCVFLKIGHVFSVSTSWCFQAEQRNEWNKLT